MWSLVVGRTTHVTRWATAHLQFMSQTTKLFFISNDAVSLRKFKGIRRYLLPVLDVNLLLFKAVELPSNHLHLLHLGRYYMSRQYSSIAGHAGYLTQGSESW